MNKKKVPIIVGPTAVGKTRLSLGIAEKIGAEIISADSRQIYRFMDIGTAKPSLAERQLIPHHFIDIRNPDEEYSAGEFGKEARRVIADLQSQSKIPIVVGGAGFYIRALVDGLSSPKIGNPEIKKKLKARLRTEGLANLRMELERIDPAAAVAIHPKDWHRTLRALEVYEITHKPFSSFKDQPPVPPDFEPDFIGLTCERQRLYRMIEQRVDQMLQLGLVDEVRQLQSRGYDLSLNALQTVGYQEVFYYLNQQISYSEMVDLIKKHTRHYAKRQLTWFKADPRIAWYKGADLSKIELLIQSIVEDLKNLT